MLSVVADGGPEEAARGSTRRRRRRQLTTVEEQLEWLESWCMKTRRGGRAPAEQLAWRQLRSTAAARGSANTEDMVGAAVTATFRRVRQRLLTKGPIEEEGAGFRGYCRVVLTNEVRRGLAAAARRHARQLQPDEALYFALDDEAGLFADPAREIDVVRLGVCVWPHAWYEGIVQRQEAHEGHGLLELSSPRDIKFVAVAATQAREDFTEIDLNVGGVDRLRVASHAVVGLHVKLALLGYTTRGNAEDHPLGKPKVLLETRRGVGLVAGLTAAENVAGLSSSISLPWTTTGPPSAAIPRRLPPRTFTPCDAPPAGTTAQLLAALSSHLEYDSAWTANSPRPWLGADHVHQVAQAVLPPPDTPPEDVSRLICALAEWSQPGLHPPHRSGHPGGHPLDAAIRDAVAHEDPTVPIWKRTPTSPNAQSQARSRLGRRVQDTLGDAGLVVHGGWDVIS